MWFKIAVREEGRGDHVWDVPLHPSKVICVRQVDMAHIRQCRTQITLACGMCPCTRTRPGLLTSWLIDFCITQL